MNKPKRLGANIFAKMNDSRLALASRARRGKEQIYSENYGDN